MEKNKNINLTDRETELLKIVVESEIKSFGDNNPYLKIEYIKILDKLKL